MLRAASTIAKSSTVDILLHCRPKGNYDTGVTLNGVIQNTIHIIIPVFLIPDLDVTIQVIMKNFMILNAFNNEMHSLERLLRVLGIPQTSRGLPTLVQALEAYATWKKLLQTHARREVSQVNTYPN